MATAQETTLPSTHIECPKCVNKLTKPLLLKCQHYFCKTCVDDFQQVTESSEYGINCPICETFSLNNDVQKIEFIQELFDSVTKAKTVGSVCVSCDKAKPEFRCEDCKGNFCQICKNTRHDTIPILKSHTWKPFDNKNSAVVDCTLFCKHHPTQTLSFYCVDCTQLVCFLCDKTDHKSHTLETVDDALKKMKPKLKIQQDDIAAMLQDKQKVLQNLISTTEIIKKKYEDMENEIDKEYERLRKKLDDDKNTLKKELSEVRTHQTAFLGQDVEFVERSIRLHKNALALSQTTIESVEGTSLIQLIESTDFKTVLSPKSDTLQSHYYQFQPISGFYKNEKNDENLLGFIQGKIIVDVSAYGY